MIDYDNNVLSGTIIRGDQLLLPRSKSIHGILLKNPYVKINNFKRNSCGSEIIELELIRLQIPDEPVFPIQASESIAIVCHKEDRYLPEVFATRRDFPVGLPHSNAKPYLHPVSICVSDVPFSEMRLQFNVYDFISCIRSWFELNSVNKLHEDDRPLEFFFIPEKTSVLINPNKQDYNHFFLKYNEITDFTSTMEFVEKSAEATHCYLSVDLNPAVSRNAALIPRNIGELCKIETKNGESLSQEIQKQILAFFKKNDLPIIVCLFIPLLRTKNSTETATELFLIKISTHAIDIYNKSKALSSESFSVWYNSIPIEIIFPLPGLDRMENASLNGLNLLCNKMSIIGVGTLGSNIVDHFVREGICEEMILIDMDYFYPHNFCRHTLSTTDLMNFKVKSLCQKYKGISGQKIIPINKDVIQLSENEKKRAYFKSDLIIDTSTSIFVERSLAFDKTLESIRKCSAFLNPKGDDLVMLMEDKGGKQRLDLLEMSYYRELITNPLLSSHLEIADKLRTNSFSCRSESNVINYDNIGVLSSIASQQLKIQFVDSQPHVSIWHIDASTCTVNKYNVPVLEWSKKTNKNTTIYIANVVIEELSSLRSMEKKETGGCLFGCFDRDRNVIYLLYNQLAPIDSKKSSLSFIRGYQGLSEASQIIRQKTYYQVRYLGEWHSHPGKSSCSPSATDDRQFEEMSNIMSQEDLPFVQIIIGYDGYYLNCSM